MEYCSEHAVAKRLDSIGGLSFLPEEKQALGEVKLMYKAMSYASMCKPNRENSMLLLFLGGRGYLFLAVLPKESSATGSPDSRRYLVMALSSFSVACMMGSLSCQRQHPFTILF